MNRSSYKLRAALVFILFFICFAGAIANLFILQITKHDFFVDLATKQYNVLVTTPADRACIVDRNGNPLALNHESIAAFVLPKKLKDSAGLKKFLQKHFPSAVARLKKNAESHFVYIKRKLTSEEQKLIAESGLEDIHLLAEPSRFYPSPATGTITGITNIDNQGLFGIELQYNQRLSGTPTTSMLERDARSGHFHFSHKTMTQGDQAKPVKLTIDGTLQFFVQEELSAQAAKFKTSDGAAVVIDPDTGDILAMATIPTFNPSDTRDIDLSTTKNSAVTESYEFGSAIKSFAALAALEEGVVTPDEMIDCEGTKTTIVEGRRINTVEAQGIVPFEDVIARSNNIGIAKVAKRMGPALYKHYKKLGFGTKTGIPFPGEQAGFVNPPERWSKQSIISLSYGYELRTTLLRLTTAFGVFATNGHLITPRLVLEPEEYTKPPEKIFSDKSIAQMRAILEKTTSTAGSARRASTKGYTTLGKTSTANLLVNGEYDSTKNLYGFVGIIEKGHYKRLIGLFLKESPYHDLYAATVAAPLFKKIAEKMLIHDHVLTGEDDADSSNSTAPQAR